MIRFADRKAAPVRRLNRRRENLTRHRRICPGPSASSVTNTPCRVQPCKAYVLSLTIQRSLIHHLPKACASRAQRFLPFQRHAETPCELQRHSGFEPKKGGPPVQPAPNVQMRQRPQPGPLGFPLGFPGGRVQMRSAGGPAATAA